MSEVIFRLADKSEAFEIMQFQLAMALETEKLKLDEQVCLKGVEAVFKDPDKGIYHVIEFEKKVIGSLLIVPEWSDWRNGTVWWIHSVYLLPEFRGRGYFARFYKYIQNLVKADEKLRGLRLYVDKTNVKATAVYKKIGMNNQHYDLFEWMKTF